MANGGWYGTEEEWIRFEAPLKQLDPALDRFAAAHELTITRNRKDWPERSMAWGTDVRSLIQVYVDNEESLRVNLWICASQDRNGSRYWRNEFLCKSERAEDIVDRLPGLLKSARMNLGEWCERPGLFEFATKITQLP